MRVKHADIAACERTVRFNPAAGPAIIVIPSGFGRLGKTLEKRQSPGTYWKAGFFMSGVSSSMPFIFISGQYRPVEVERNKGPIFRPWPWPAKTNELVEHVGGPDRPPPLNMILL